VVERGFLKNIELAAEAGGHDTSSSVSESLLASDHNIIVHVY
jgi:hypothetical protein